MDKLYNVNYHDKDMNYKELMNKIYRLSIIGDKIISL